MAWQHELCSITLVKSSSNCAMNMMQTVFASCWLCPSQLQSQSQCLSSPLLSSMLSVLGPHDDVVVVVVVVVIVLVQLSMCGKSHNCTRHCNTNQVDGHGNHCKELAHGGPVAVHLAKSLSHQFGLAFTPWNRAVSILT